MDQPTSDRSLLRALRERRVFQVVGIYLGVVLGAFEFTGLVVERYGWSDRLIDLVLAGTLAMFPTVLMVAWFHGAPGKERWHLVEKIGIPANVLAAVALLLLLSPGTPDGVSETRVASTDDGERYFVEVPRTDLLRRVAVFFFDPAALPDAQRWQGYAVPLLTATASDRSRFLDVIAPYSGELYWRIGRAGYQDGFGAPVSLLREVAAGYHRDHFVTGALAPSNDGGLAVSFVLYETEPLRELASRTLTGADFYAVSEELVAFIVQALRPETARDEGVIELLPIREVLSQDEAALRSFVEARNARLFAGDTDRAIALARAAVDRDPTFAAAHVYLAQLLSEQGDFEGALAQLRNTNRLQHRLSQSERIRLKAFAYGLQGQTDKALDVHRMWVDLEPDNYEALNALALNLKWNSNELAEAAATLERSLEVLPAQDWVLNQLADLYRLLGDTDRATALYEDYHRRRPSEYLPLVTIGDMRTEAGDLVAARSYYRKGNIAASEMVTPVLRLAENALRRGDYAEAEDVLLEAEFVAAAPRQRATVARMRSQMAALRGRHAEAVAALEAQVEELLSAGNVNEAMVVRLRGAWLYAAAGRGDESAAYISELRENFQPPFDFVPALGGAMLAVSRGELEVAEREVATIRASFEALDRSDFAYLASMVEGLVLAARGAHREAVVRLERALEEYGASVQRTADPSSHFDERELLLALTRAYQASGRESEALTVLDRMLLPWPHHPEANLLKARLLAQQGDAAGAAEPLERALAGWAVAEPGFALAAEARSLARELGIATPDGESSPGG